MAKADEQDHKTLKGFIEAIESRIAFNEAWKDQMEDQMKAAYLDAFSNLDYSPNYSPTPEEIHAWTKRFPKGEIQAAPQQIADKPALERQVGGGHYKKYKIQPVEFIHANNIGFCEASAIKYLCRWRDKGGVADLEKAKHFIDLLIDLEKQNASVIR